MLRNLTIAGVVAAGATAVGIAGYAAGASGTLDVLGEGTVQAPFTAAPLYACPDGEPVADLHRGDRVFLTGRDDDGAWVELRSPFDGDDRMWLPAEHVAADDTVEDLPVRDCVATDGDLTLTLADGSEVEVTTTLPPEMTTTTLLPGETTTTTTRPGTPTTAAPAPGQTTLPPPPPPPPPTTTSTLPPLSISQAGISPAPMIERYMPSPGTCQPQGGAETSTLTAQVSGATSGTYSLSIGGGGSFVTQGSGSWTAAVGPFPHTTVDAHTQVTATLEFVGPGGAALRQVTFVLRNCSVPG